MRFEVELARIGDYDELVSLLQPLNSEAPSFPLSKPRYSKSYFYSLIGVEIPVS